ncbi:MAG: hypothetical protein R2725_09270 [Solirubrobacterales bacterium]
MLGRKAFFSFVSVAARERHADYNAWHQLDHLPENLALPGVLHGERWVRTPACAALGPEPDPALRAVHYVAAYWFAAPSAASIAAWQELAERSFQWGRRPDRPWVERPLMGFFSIVSARVARRLRVSPEALPLRPLRGVQVTVTRVAEPHGDAAEAAFRWQEAEHLPALLERPGVAGAYVFSGDSTTLDAGWRERPGTTTFDAGSGERGQLRVYLCFLDAEPLECAAGWPPAVAPGGAEEVLFAAPLEKIEPWRWDWFEPAR